MPHHQIHINLSKREQETIIDKIVQVAAFIYPLSGLPQVYLVMKGEISGVSLVSWMAFSVFSLVFMMYGILHKMRPIIIVNLCWLVIDLLIIFGILVHRV